MKLNPTLLHLARHQVWKQASQFEKVAVVPPGGDPSQMGGAPPGMDPSQMGGAPPGMGPSQMGGQPGGAAPMPAPQMAPPPQPQPGAGAMPMGAGGPAGAVADPANAMAMGQPAPKLKPEQMMQMLDFRLYNMQQQLTQMMNSQGITMPPGALVTPPGSPTPVAEAAVPGGPNDPGQTQQGGNGGGGGGGNSSISPIDAIQGASPSLAGGGGGGTKAGFANRNLSFSDLIEKLADNAGMEDDEDIESQNDNNTDTAGTDNTDADSQASFDQQTLGDWMDNNTKVGSVGTPYGTYFAKQSPAQNAMAIAAMLRQRTAGNP